MTPEDLAQYATVMREHGVSYFELGGVKVSLGPKPVVPGPGMKQTAPRKTDYEKLMFAATEGLAEDDE